VTRIGEWPRLIIGYGVDSFFVGSSPTCRTFNSTNNQMITLTEKEKEILFETINFYNLENRGYNKASGNCVYKTQDHKRCAVGRCMTDEGIKFANAFPDDGETSVDVINKEVNIDSLLQEKYQGASLEFWKELQLLHDISTCWDKYGITNYGKNMVKNNFGITL
jgi:hypothetical protein